jgi:uncharacterized metal-binding protein (TIGR02443 family)
LTEVTNIYIKIIDHCPKCGNKVLSDESYYHKNKPIVIVGCIKCGYRWYPNDKEIEDLIKYWESI